MGNRIPAQSVSASVTAWLMILVTSCLVSRSASGTTSVAACEPLATPKVSLLPTIGSLISPVMPPIVATLFANGEPGEPRGLGEVCALYARRRHDIFRQHQLALAAGGNLIERARRVGGRRRIDREGEPEPSHEDIRRLDRGRRREFCRTRQRRPAHRHRFLPSRRTDSPTNSPALLDREACVDRKANRRSQTIASISGDTDPADGNAIFVKRNSARIAAEWRL